MQLGVTLISWNERRAFRKSGSVSRYLQCRLIRAGWVSSPRCHIPFRITRILANNVRRNNCQTSIKADNWRKHILFDGQFEFRPSMPGNKEQLFSDLEKAHSGALYFPFSWLTLSLLFFISLAALQAPPWLLWSTWYAQSQTINSIYFMLRWPSTDKTSGLRKSSCWQIDGQILWSFQMVPW